MKLVELSLLENQDIFGFDMLNKAVDSGAKIWFTQQGRTGAGELLRVELEIDPMMLGTDTKYVNFFYRLEDNGPRTKRKPDRAEHMVFINLKEFDERVRLQPSKHSGFKWDLVLRRPTKPKLTEETDSSLLLVALNSLLRNRKPLFIRVHRGGGKNRKSALAKVFLADALSISPDQLVVRYDASPWNPDADFYASTLDVDDWTISKEEDIWVLHKV